jgi:hypothetical protein
MACAALTMAWLWAHDAAYHAVQLYAEQFIKTQRGQTEMNKALAAMDAALRQNNLRAPNRDLFLSQGKKVLEQLVEQQLSESLAHVLRTWTLNEAKPSPQVHVQRCRVCNSIITALLEQQKLKPVPDVKPNAKFKLTDAKVKDLLQKRDHKTYFDFAVELCDLNGDGFIDAVRLDSKTEGAFSTYQVDYDSDGLVDAVATKGSKGWALIAAQSEKQ